MRRLSDFRHILWDFNGTLFNDVALCSEILNEIITERGHKPISIDVYRKEFCHPVRTFYSRIGICLSQEEYMALSEDFHRKYEERLDRCGLFDSALELLESVSAADVSQSILSALPEEILLPLVDRLNIGSFFSEIVGGKDKSADGKVGAALEWKRDRGFRVDELVMIGDTDHDAEVARAMGCHCFLIASGFQAREVLEAQGVPVLDSLRDLVA